jgi:uncharacterized protein YjdB
MLSLYALASAPVASGPLAVASDSGSDPTVTVAGVSVTPVSKTLAGNGTQSFSAAVSGTNSPSQAVVWTAAAGSITSGGLFTAPAATLSVQTITVTATSVADSTKSGTAVVTVPAAVSSGPPEVTMDANLVPKLRWITFPGTSRVVTFQGARRVVAFEGNKRTVRFQ